MARIFCFAIQVYQVCISPFFPALCRYWPTCSVYAAKAVREHGVAAGSLLALRRIFRCHPWGGWGYDPVPESHEYDACCEENIDGDHTPTKAAQTRMAKLEQGT